MEFGRPVSPAILRDSRLAHLLADGVPVDDIQEMSGLKLSQSVATEINLDLAAFATRFAELHPRYDV